MGDASAEVSIGLACDVAAAVWFVHMCVVVVAASIGWICGDESEESIRYEAAVASLCRNWIM